MHDHDDHDFAYASDNALKSLRAIFMLAGRTPDQALADAVAVVVSLLDHGGAGWIERLIDAQASAELSRKKKAAVGA